jgi:hypothetical protein
MDRSDRSEQRQKYRNGTHSRRRRRRRLHVCIHTRTHTHYTARVCVPKICILVFFSAALRRSCRFRKSARRSLGCGSRRETVTLRIRQRSHHVPSATVPSDFTRTIHCGRYQTTSFFSFIISLSLFSHRQLSPASLFYRKRCVFMCTDDLSPPPHPDTCFYAVVPDDRVRERKSAPIQTTTTTTRLLKRT